MSDIIRTELSFSLDIEIDGVLPWRAAARTTPPAHDVNCSLEPDPA